MDKPFSQACANNQDIISQMLTSVLTDKKRVLEIGSGTGQHGVFFAKKLPHLTWQMSDRRQSLAGIQCWMDDNPAPIYWLKPWTPLEVGILTKCPIGTPRRLGLLTLLMNVITSAKWLNIPNGRLPSIVFG